MLRCAIDLRGHARSSAKWLCTFVCHLHARAGCALFSCCPWARATLAGHAGELVIGQAPAAQVLLFLLNRPMHGLPGQLGRPHRGHPGRPDSPISWIRAGTCDSCSFCSHRPRLEFCRLGQIWPGFGQQTSPELDSTLRFRTSWARCRPKVAKLGQGFAGLGQSSALSAEFGQRLANSGGPNWRARGARAVRPPAHPRPRPRPRPRAPPAGQCPPTPAAFGPNWADGWPYLANFGQLRLNLARKRPNLDRAQRLTFQQNSAPCKPTWARIRPAKTMLDQSSFIVFRGSRRQF